MSIKHVLISSAGFACLAILGSLMPPHQAAAQPARPVTAVELTGPIPLPVTGNVGITGTPAVNVNSLPAVNLTAGNTVQIGNPPSSPLPVREVRTRHTVHSDRLTCFLTIETSAPICNGPSFIVPPGRRLVVTYFSVQAEGLQAGQAVIGLLRSTGTAGDYALPMTPPALAAGRTSGGAHMDIRFESGITVTPSCLKSSSEAGGLLNPPRCSVSFAGYLEDSL
jgi:hypothetical protein